MLDLGDDLAYINALINASITKLVPQVELPQT